MRWSLHFSSSLCYCILGYSKAQVMENLWGDMRGGLFEPIEQSPRICFLLVHACLITDYITIRMQKGLSEQNVTGFGENVMIIVLCCADRYTISQANDLWSIAFCVDTEYSYLYLVRK